MSEEHKPAFIMWKKEKEDQTWGKIKEKINSKIDTLRETKKLTEAQDGSIGAIHDITGTELRICVLDIYRYFNEYREYDNFLIELVEDADLYGLEDGGVIIGHMDGGSLWTDYPTQSQQAIRNRETLEKHLQK